MGKICFLTLTQVLTIHQDQIKRYGGTMGVRDVRLLESAVAQPQASFGGNWLHENIFLMAAAYAFHICEDHGFLDGNKRTALATALVFLEMNGISISDPRQKLFGAMISLAQGKLTKPALAEVFKGLM